MTTRRTVIKAMAAMPSVFSLGSVWAAGDPTRLALVIGNSAYRSAPLLNPGNDAGAMAGLLGQAGFTVESHLDLTRTAMVTAIEKFGASIRRPETRQVVFYYAGHGVQLDWRNYLAPVDAKVDTAEQLRQNCVDLGLLLKVLSGAGKNQTFIIILDACRDNPFGSAYKPEQAGLAQFDAPVGSLLAYATSPGKGAADDGGNGKNGLYTEHLLRELSKRGTRIEDALKRVRLNVRLASRGTQIPWETTSLESDVFLFNDGQARLSAAEIERQIEADLAAWGRVKGSNRVDDWVGYVRDFPNGRFSEIAQVRINRLMEEAEKIEIAAREAKAAQAAEAVRIAEAADAAKAAQAVKLAEAAKPLEVAKIEPAKTIVPVVAIVSAAAATDQWAIELGPGVPVPALLRLSSNPYSAGFYPFARKYSVGDNATYRESDLLTGLAQRVYRNVVTRVDVAADRVEVNDGKIIVDLMGNLLRNEEREFDVPRQNFPAELQVGKKWKAAFVETRSGVKNRIAIDFHVARRETITVPAGTFEVFRIEGSGWSIERGTHLEMRNWVIPKLNAQLKWEILSRAQDGRYMTTMRTELISMQQRVVSS